MKHRVQVTLDGETYRYLHRLVETGEAASLSHAIRRVVKEHRRMVRTRREGLEAEKHE